MHNNFMDTVHYPALTPANFHAHTATHTWETFEVVDAGSGEIALWSRSAVLYVSFITFFWALYPLYMIPQVSCFPLKKLYK